MEDRIDQLILTYLRKEATSAEYAELLQWLNESDKNQRYFRSVKDVYDLGQFEKHFLNSQTEQQWKKLHSSLVTQHKTNRRAFYVKEIMKYAAIFVAGIFFMQLFSTLLDNNSHKYTHTQTTIETGIGERSKVNLPDGTTVWLNACSSISFDESFGKTNRSVSLKGEAFFDVEKDKMKPFLVLSDIFTYRVTGTSFNIYSFAEDNISNIVLVEGSVIVEKSDFHQELSPGDLLEYNKTTQQISKRKTNVNLHTNWRKGELIFDNVTFDELTKRLERNFNISFKVENPQIRNEYYGGTFRNYDSLETILKVISTSAPIKYSIEKDTVYIK